VGRSMPVWYLVPDGVVQYIEKRGLYREGPRRGAADDARPTYDRPPASSSTPPGDSDPQPPNPHLQEVPR
jgi:nicotinate-nucleotide adenylyltransferase